MGTYCMAQETLLNAPSCPKWEGDPKGVDTCIRMADSFYVVDAKTTLQSNYNAIQTTLNLKEKKMR